VWQALQAAGLAATALLLAGLLAWPEISLRLLWKVVIPLVPASLLVTPALWRNVCPLATLNVSTARVGRGRSASRWMRVSVVVGIALLAILVPARRVVFDTDGAALAATILAVAASKGGFCNAFCPVLPVERLYGQSPLVRIDNAHCAECTTCSPACIDLSPRAALASVIGPARRSARWVATPYGAFAAGFPGFVLGFFLTADGVPADALRVYLTVLGAAAGSWGLVATTAGAFRIPASRGLPALAALAAGIYYWFASPDLARAIAMPDPSGSLLRAAAVGLVAFWWWRARPAGGRVRIG
jgi:hypothetical protein